jgi:hypothetical protein
MNTIRRIGVWSCAKVYAVCGLLTGGLLGGIIILLTIIGGAFDTSGLTGMDAGAGIAGALMATGFMIVAYGIGGLVVGVFTALFGNLALKLCGGLEIKIDAP